MTTIPQNGQKRKIRAPSEFDVQAPPLEVCDAVELLHRDYEPLQWIIPGYLPEGLTLLFSRPKVGKSMTALALSLRVARRVSGGVDGEVLYLSLDDTSERRMQSRIRSLLQGEVLEEGRIWAATKAQKLDTGLIGQLQRWMEDRPLTRLVIIDVYARIKPKSKDDDVYRADYDALVKLQEFAVAHHIGIILVHHTRKAANTSGDWIDNVNGSTGLTGAADTLWMIEREPRSNDLTLRVKGRDVMNELELHLSLDDLDAPWALTGEESPEEQQRISRMEHQILDLLSAGSETSETKNMASETKNMASETSETKHGPWKPMEIAKHIDGNKDSVRRVLSRMVAKNLIVRSTYGAYEMPQVRQVRQKKIFSDFVSLVSLPQKSAVSQFAELPLGAFDCPTCHGTNPNCGHRFASPKGENHE